MLKKKKKALKSSKLLSAPSETLEVLTLTGGKFSNTIPCITAVLSQLYQEGAWGCSLHGVPGWAGRQLHCTHRQVFLAATWETALLPRSHTSAKSDCPTPLATPTPGLFREASWGICGWLHTHRLGGGNAAGRQHHWCPNPALLWIQQTSVCGCSATLWAQGHVLQPCHRVN